MIKRLTIGVRAADHFFADVATLRTGATLNTFGRNGTIAICLTFDSKTTAFVVGVADETISAGTMECSLVVFTIGSWSAWGISTEVDGLATHEWITAEARLAIAYLFVIFRRAEGIFTAWFANETGDFANVILAQFVSGTIFVCLAFDATATSLWVTSEALFTRAQRLMTASSTFGITTAKDAAIARVSTIGATVRIDDAILADVTVFVGLTTNFLCTNIVQAVLEVRTAGIAMACWLTHALKTELIANTVTVRTAQI